MVVPASPEDVAAAQAAAAQRVRPEKARPETAAERAERVAAAVLVDMLAEAGDGVSVKDWCDACIASRDLSNSESRDAQRSAFNRACAALKDRGEIAISGEIVRRVSQ